MKIVILGSVALPVPPHLQGGTERIAYYQAKGLAQKGHDVTLIATKGSQEESSYTLVEIGGGDTVTGSSREAKSTEIVESSRSLRKEIVYLAEVAQWLIDHQDRYDIILNNMRGEAIFLPTAKQIGKRFVCVMHLPLFAQLAEIFRRYNTPIITISNAQRKEFPNLAYVGTVYNGIDTSMFPFGEKAGEYLLMMGSIAPHKNQAAGIRIAKATGKKLILAGKIGNPAYYEKEIAPAIDGKNIIHIGEIGHEEKIALYQGALALLFPVLWEEPFGLVMIESMACGTPVVAYNRGAVPEVVVDGVTGFIVHEEREMTEKISSGVLRKIVRQQCRDHVQKHFTTESMNVTLDRVLTNLPS